MLHWDTAFYGADIRHFGKQIHYTSKILMNGWMNEWKLKRANTVVDRFLMPAGLDRRNSESAGSSSGQIIEICYDFPCCFFRASKEELMQNV